MMIKNVGRVYFTITISAYIKPSHVKIDIVFFSAPNKYIFVQTYIRRYLKQWNIICKIIYFYHSILSHVRNVYNYITTKRPNQIIKSKGIHEA